MQKFLVVFDDVIDFDQKTFDPFLQGEDIKF